MLRIRRPVIYWYPLVNTQGKCGALWGECERGVQCIGVARQQLYFIVHEHYQECTKTGGFE